MNVHIARKLCRLVNMGESLLGKKIFFSHQNQGILIVKFGVQPEFFFLI